MSKQLATGADTVDTSCATCVCVCACLHVCVDRSQMDKPGKTKNSLKTGGTEVNLK